MGAGARFRCVLRVFLPSFCLHLFYVGGVVWWHLSDFDGRSAVVGSSCLSGWHVYLEGLPSVITNVPLCLYLVALLGDQVEVLVCYYHVVDGCCLCDLPILF